MRISSLDTPGVLLYPERKQTQQEQSTARQSEVAFTSKGRQLPIERQLISRHDMQQQPTYDRFYQQMPLTLIARQAVTQYTETQEVLNDAQLQAVGNIDIVV